MTDAIEEEHRRPERRAGRQDDDDRRPKEAAVEDVSQVFPIADGGGILRGFEIPQELFERHSVDPREELDGLVRPRCASAPVEACFVENSAGARILFDDLGQRPVLGNHDRTWSASSSSRRSSAKSIPCFSAVTSRECLPPQQRSILYFASTASIS